MRTRSLWGALCVGLSICVGGSCLAANLQPVQGQVYIDQGRGFQLLSGPAEANVGDLVMVSPGSLAALTYADGCKVGIQAGQIIPVTRISPCTNPFGKTDVVDQANPPPSDNTAFALGVTGAVLGAAGLGAGIAAIVKDNNNNNSTCGNTISSPCYTYSP